MDESYQRYDALTTLTNKSSLLYTDTYKETGILIHMKKPGISPIWIALIAIALLGGVVAVNMIKDGNTPKAVEHDHDGDGKSDHGADAH
jgi:hypothetical protein